MQMTRMLSGMDARQQRWQQQHNHKHGRKQENKKNCQSLQNNWIDYSRRPEIISVPPSS